MNDLQPMLDAAVASGDAPFVVAALADREGLIWSGHAGEAPPGRPAGPDTLLRLYSMTKAIGVTGAMILADRGLLDIDAPVERYLPEIARLRVLEGYDGDTPITRAPKVPITTRHIATHTSGLSYEMNDAGTDKWLGATGTPSTMHGQRAGLFYPLIFDPGSQWQYGMGIGWIGALIEAIDGRRVDLFCQQEIFDPLGMIGTRFEIDTEDEQRFSHMSLRGPDGSFETVDFRMPVRPELYNLGGCLYSSVTDYVRFLRMHLNDGQLDGARILNEATARRMRENMIGDVAIRVMVSNSPMSRDFVFFPDQKKSHSLLGMRVDEDVPGMRSAGTNFWAGGANSHFWVDVEQGLAGVFATQLMPFLDERFCARYEQFEQAAYRALR